MLISRIVRSFFVEAQIIAAVEYVRSTEDISEKGVMETHSNVDQIKLSGRSGWRGWQGGVMGDVPVAADAGVRPAIHVATD